MARDARKVQAFERLRGTDRVEAERWIALLQTQDQLLEAQRETNAHLAELVRLLTPR
jgi:hypothetical protein